MIESTGRWSLECGAKGSGGGGIVGLGFLPLPSKSLLLLTASAQLFMVPVEAMAKALPALRPRSLKVWRKARTLDSQGPIRRL